MLGQSQVGPTVAPHTAIKEPHLQSSAPCYQKTAAVNVTKPLGDTSKHLLCAIQWGIMMEAAVLRIAKAAVIVLTPPPMTAINFTEVTLAVEC